MIQVYKNIWFCGLAASGKTMVLQKLRQKYPEAQYFNDSEEIVEFVRQDKTLEHHIEPSPETFLLTDSAAVYYSIDSLIEKAMHSNKVNLIELSRGLDQEKKVDFSYKYLFSQLPETITKSSLFVYVSTPYEVRRQRNMARPKLGSKVTAFSSFYCPEEAMERFFQVDDFFEAIEEYPVDTFILPNISSLEEYSGKIELLFDNRTVSFSRS